MNSRLIEEDGNVGGAEAVFQLSIPPVTMSYKQRGPAFVLCSLFRDQGTITGATCAWSALIGIGMSLMDVVRDLLGSMTYNPWGEGIYRLRVARSVRGNESGYHGVKKSMTCHGTPSGALSHRPDSEYINISRNVKSNPDHPGWE